MFAYKNAMIAPEADDVICSLVQDEQQQQCEFPSYLIRLQVELRDYHKIESSASILLHAMSRHTLLLMH